jgi:hypothetical protein
MDNAGIVDFSYSTLHIEGGNMGLPSSGETTVYSQSAAVATPPPSETAEVATVEPHHLPADELRVRASMATEDTGRVGGLYQRHNKRATSLAAMAALDLRACVRR